MGTLLRPELAGESEHVPYIKTRRLCRVHKPGMNLPAERCPPEEVHDGLPVTPLLQIPRGVQELVSSRPPQLNKLNQQGMTCGHTQPYNAQAIVSLRLAQQETTVVTESDGRVAMPVAQPLPHGLSSGHPDRPLHLERNLGGGVAAAHADIYVRDCPSGSGCTIIIEQGAWRLT